MIRRILVAIDETPASRVAQDLAIAIAKQRSAAITGVGVVDRPWATAPQAVPIGGSAYKVHRDQVVLDELRHEVEAILRTFSEACRTAGVLFSTVEVEGAPARAIESEAEGCDLIVIGKDTNFHFEAEPDMTETVARLIRENARPVLVTSAGKPTGDKVLVCYDGSVQASRAMHMFVLLGLAHDREVHLVSVARTKEALSADQQLVRRVREVGRRIAAVSERPDWDWEFILFENEIPNAFALPSGKIGVYTGLFEVAANDAQLAAVLSHEVAHAIARHGAERLSQQLALQTVLAMLGVTTGQQAYVVRKARPTRSGCATWPWRATTRARRSGYGGISRRWTSDAPPSFYRPIPCPRPASGVSRR